MYIYTYTILYIRTCTQELIASTKYNPEIQSILTETLPSAEKMAAHNKANEPERVFYCLQVHLLQENTATHFSQNADCFVCVRVCVCGCVCVCVCVRERECARV